MTLTRIFPLILAVAAVPVSVQAHVVGQHGHATHPWIGAYHAFALGALVLFVLAGLVVPRFLRNISLVRDFRRNRE
jgi:cytochrome c biogenesis protein CcdA